MAERKKRSSATSRRRGSSSSTTGRRAKKPLGRPSRIHELITEARCPICGDWIRAPIFRAHLTGRHPNRFPGKEFEIRQVPLPDRIVEHLAAGNYFDASCAAAGIHPSKPYEWIAIGEQFADVELEEIPADRRIFREFRDAVRNAREEAKVYLQRMIERAAPEDWRAAAWILERTHPGQYSRIERLRVGGDPDVGAIQVVQTFEDPDFVGKVREIYEQAGVFEPVESTNGKSPTNGTKPK